MVRSLWTAATGMIAQQTNMDTIANNLANVNTTGYKTQTNEFKSLLYQNLQTRTTTANGAQKPTGAQVGLGVRSASITTNFTEGSLQGTESSTDFALDGTGFFAVQGRDGQTYYTRNGNFKFTLAPGGGNMLANSQGYPVIDTNGKPIVLDERYTISNVTVTADGTICYPDEKNNAQSLGIQIGVFQFNNPRGLSREGDSLYAQTANSGAPMNEATNSNLQKTSVIQGYLEMSNVQVVDEMVNMITTQRAYELNSKAITTTDTMLDVANNLKR